jgi:hypothetical protein
MLIFDGIIYSLQRHGGIPVICSDQVGARVLVETFAAGDVFPRGDAMVLATLLTWLPRLQSCSP